MGKTKQIAVTIVVGIGVIALFGFAKYLKISKAIAEGKSFAPPPPAITTFEVREMQWARVMTSVGTIVAAQGITLTSEEGGRIEKIAFESGARVPADASLFVIDSSVEQANLKAALASAEQANSALKRAEMLRSANANSISDLEAAQAHARSQQAQVEAIRAVIAKKNIGAPFAGRLGIRSVNIGQYVTPGTPLVPLYDLGKMYVNYTAPQQLTPALRVGQGVELTVDAYPGRVFRGEVTAINPQVNESSRNFALQATFQNEDESLRPGMFGEVTHLLSDAQPVIAVPSTSISYAPYGDTVYVVEPKKTESGESVFTVRQQVVKLGERRGDLVQVESGLKVGEQVASSGTFKLRPDERVVINNSFQPDANLDPEPADS